MPSAEPRPGKPRTEARRSDTRQAESRPAENRHADVRAPQPKPQPKQQARPKRPVPGLAAQAAAIERMRSPRELERWLRERFDRVGGVYDLASGKVTLI